MPLFTIEPVDNDLYSDVVGAGTPAGGDDIEITRGYNEYTTGLTFTANNWGDVLVGQGFYGKIGASGSPWLLQANTASKFVSLLGGREIYLSAGGSTIARLVIDMADPAALVVVSSASGTVGDVMCGRGAVELADSIATLNNLYAEPGGRPKVRGSGSASAMTTIVVGHGGECDTARDFANATVNGRLVISDDRVTPSGAVIVNGELKIRECGTFAGTSTMTLNEGSVLDLSESMTELSPYNMVLGDNCRVIQRHGGPGYTVQNSTTTRGRGPLVEKVTR